MATEKRTGACRLVPAAFRTAPWVHVLSLLALISCTLATEVRAVDGFGWDVERDHVSLNGRWHVLPGHGEAEVWEAEVAAALGPWESVFTPGVLLPEADTETVRGTQCVWARRTFELNPQQAARDGVLRWGSVDFGATAWLNGRRLGLHRTKGPCTFLIPDGVLKSGENVLVLRVRGWAGIPRGGSGFPLLPTGSGIEGWGSKRPAIFDDVRLEFYERAYMKWILALPDLEDGSVTFRVWLDGLAELPAEMEIRAVVRPRDSVQVSGEGRGSAAATDKPTDVRVPLRDVHPWRPQAPYLYTAEVQLRAEGEPCDAARFRFGMRQVQVADGHYRLNGRRLRLRGSNLVNEWRWGDTFNPEVKRYLVDEGRAMNLNCFRTHTLPPPAMWADTCDEHGVMILAEFPVLYNYKEFRFTGQEWAIFHENVLRDATGWVTKLWNHPAIVMWVLSNESREDAEWEKGPYRDHVLALDPTRPTMRTGGHTEETRDLHTCGNFSYGCEGDMLHTVREAAEHKDPHRTLTNTEYMNIFGPYDAIVTRWLGRPDHPEKKRVFAEFAHEHTEAMRRLDYDCILPYMYAGWPRFRGNDWRPDYPTPMAAALHSSMAPVLATWELFDRNFRPGEEVTSPLWLINDSFEDVPARVEVFLTPEDPLFVPDAGALQAAVWTTSFEHTFAADSSTQREVRWRVPEEEGTYYLAAVVRREGDRPVVSQRTVRSVPVKAQDAPAHRRRIAVLGTEDAMRSWLDRRDLSWHGALPEQAGTDDVILLWQPSPATGEELAAAAEAGARIVIMNPAQWEWPELADLRVVEVRSSRAFPYPGAEDHPLFSGLDPECLKRWNGEPGTIAEGALEGGAIQEGRRLLWVGSPDSPAVLSLPVGRGELIVCLLHIRERMADGGRIGDPAAERILLNLLTR